jgi:hypothetical protein
MPKLSDRAAAEQDLNKALVAVESRLSALIASIIPAQEASDRLYNASVAQGISGSSTAVRNMIESRIHHRLRLEASMPGFDMSLSPTGKTPLGTTPEPYTGNRDFETAARRQAESSAPAAPEPSRQEMYAQARKARDELGVMERPSMTLREVAEQAGR